MGAMTLPPVPVRQRLAVNVRRLRDERGWTQDTLADKANMHHNQVSSVERAKSNVRIDIVEKLAHALNVSLGSLLDSIFSVRGIILQAKKPACIGLQSTCQRSYLEIIDTGGSKFDPSECRLAHLEARLHLDTFVECLQCQPSLKSRLPDPVTDQVTQLLTCGIIVLSPQRTGPPHGATVSRVSRSGAALA